MSAPFFRFEPVELPPEALRSRLDCEDSYFWHAERADDVIISAAGRSALQRWRTHC
jgi:hypothetical protein